MDPSHEAKIRALMRSVIRDTAWAMIIDMIRVMPETGLGGSGSCLRPLSGVERMAAVLPIFSVSFPTLQCALYRHARHALGS